MTPKQIKEKFIMDLKEGKEIRLTTAREGRQLAASIEILEKEGIKNIANRYDGNDIIIWLVK